MDDVLSLNNAQFSDDLIIFTSSAQINLKVKTQDTPKSASFLDLHFEIDNDGWLNNKTI